MDKLQQKLGYRFHNPALLQSALIHSSYANEHKPQGLSSNERLEFLGDAVLGLVIAQELYARFRQFPEGELSRTRAAVVCEQSLYVVAKRLGLQSYLKLGRGEEQTGGLARPSILADAVESIFAAVYLDGGLEAAREVILRQLTSAIEPGAKGQFNRDYKTVLQEIVQKNKEETLEYFLVDEQGPDHCKVFTVELRLNSNVFARAQGHSKKEAEQNAAAEALRLMGET